MYIDLFLDFLIPKTTIPVFKFIDSPIEINSVQNKQTAVDVKKIKSTSWVSVWDSIGDHNTKYISNIQHSRRIFHVGSLSLISNLKYITYLQQMHMNKTDEKGFYSKYMGGGLLDHKVLDLRILRKRFSARFWERYHKICFETSFLDFQLHFFNKRAPFSTFSTTNIQLG